MDEQQTKLCEALEKLRSRLMLSATISAETSNYDKLEKEMGWILVIKTWLATFKCN